MSPYGSMWAHIKTVRSPMAQDNFPIPCDPENPHRRPENNPNSQNP